MDSSPAKPQSYQWSEPTWSYRPRLKAEFSRLLDRHMWQRILVIVALLALGLGWTVKRALPELELTWFTVLTKLAGALACLGFYAAAMFAVFWFVSPRIKIQGQGITRQTGSTLLTILRPEIRSITIDTANAMRPWLRVDSTGRSFECGIAAKVSPAALAQFLREQFPEISVVEKN